MRVTSVSDLHGSFPETIGGDLLIIAGDCTANDKIPEWNDFFDWIDEQNYKRKVMIAGNHDNFCKSWATSDDSIYDALGYRPTVSYLCDSGITIFHEEPSKLNPNVMDFKDLVLNARKIKVWGSPWTKTFRGVNPECCAFMVETESELMDKWEKIPQDTDILITHTPAFGVLDKTPQRRCGSTSLYSTLKYVVRPKVHIFGHIHSGYGTEEHFATHDNKMMLSVNAAHMNNFYEPVNPPINFEI